MQRTGFLPALVSISITVSTTSSVVASVLTTSTSGIRKPGFQKCVPTSLSLCLHFAEISVGLITDVFVQKIVSSETIPSSCANRSCFSCISSSTHSTTRSALLTPSLSISCVKLILLITLSTSAGVTISFSTSSFMLFLIFASISTGNLSYTVIVTSSSPAKTCAMALPIIPPPQIKIFLTSFMTFLLFFY